jgi:hypothetical protein
MIGRGNQSTWRRPAPLPLFHLKSHMITPGLELKPQNEYIFKKKKKKPSMV